MTSDDPQPVVLDGRSRVSVHDFAAVADARRPLRLDGSVEGRLEAVRAAALSLSGTRPVYGRGTGVGANKNVTVEDPTAQAGALLAIHATSAGELRSPRRVRAMIAVRAAQLATPGSGIAPAVLEALLRLLEDDDLPPVRELGGIGTGDLSALATTALGLDVTLGEHDALAFLSSNAATLGDAALATADLTVLARAGVVVAALSFAGLHGNPEAYCELAESATPFPGAGEVCWAMRALTAADSPPARLQDPYGLRTLPQVHGVLLDQLAALAETVETLAATASENPVFSAHPPAVAHHGGFHAAYVATALDTARSALAQSGQLSLARLANLVEPALTGLSPFLGDRAAASGVMVLEYVVAAALARLRSAATPTAVQSVSLSRGTEDDAGFASLGAAQALAGADSYTVVLACELVAAVRALRLHGLPVPQDCSVLPTDMGDRDLTGDIGLAAGLLPALAATYPGISASGRSSSA